jgi:hypothetical protein
LAKTVLCDQAKKEEEVRDAVTERKQMVANSLDARVNRAYEAWERACFVEQRCHENLQSFKPFDEEEPPLPEAEAFAQNGAYYQAQLARWSRKKEDSNKMEFVLVERYEEAQRRQEKAAETYQSLRDQNTERAVQLGLALEQSSKPMERKVHKNLTNVVVFDPKHARTEPFDCWFKNALGTWKNLGVVDADHVVLYLQHYVHPKCWEHLRAYPSEQQTLKLILDKFDALYGDKSSQITKEKLFQEYRQETDDAAVYTAQKAVLFARAFPEQDHTTSANFRRYWLEGLWIGLREKAQEKEDYMTRPFEKLRQIVMNAERVKLEVYGTYGAADGLKSNRVRASTVKNNQANPTNMPNAQKSCKFYLEGTCRKGKDCSFKHDKKAKQALATGASRPTGNSTTQQRTNQTPNGQSAPRNQPSTPTQNRLQFKCNRTHDAGLADHPMFACKDKKLTCRKCNKSGHLSYLCPDAKCSKCGKAHEDAVCGLNPTQHF